MSNCIICDENLTPSKKTECPYCQYGPCRTCVRRYVLNENEPKCMNCKKTWTREHQNEILLQSFVNKELKQHLEQVYYEKEMSLFPATIDVIEDRKLVLDLTRERHILKEIVLSTKTKLDYLRVTIGVDERLLKLVETYPECYPDIEISSIRDELKQSIDKKRIIHKRYIHDADREKFINRILRMTPEHRKVVIANYINGADADEILNTLEYTGQLVEETKRSRTRFIRACPLENCRGFLNQQWKCTVCNVHTCSKCNVPKVPKAKDPNDMEETKDAKDPNDMEATKDAKDPNDMEETKDGHVCNPDDVATAELLANDTKPCPQCGTGIFKIDGCDQMWCTECKTAFSWRTGNVETGHVHNPHYFEYQRRIGRDARNILDVPCGGLRPEEYHGILHHLINTVVSKKSRDEKERTKRGLNLITDEMRDNLRNMTAAYSISINYYALDVLPKYRPDAIQNNLELRIRYLTEQISQVDFKHALSRETKKYSSKVEIGQVIQTVIVGMSDILNRLIGYLRLTHNNTENTNYCDVQPIFQFYSEIDLLIEYANQCLSNICEQYKLTRSAIFIRDERKQIKAGLFTTRINEEGTLIQVRQA